MGWFALWDPDGTVFDGSAIFGGIQTSDALVVRGTILLETCLTPGTKPQTLLRYEAGGSWPVQISLQSVPAGGTIFVLEQAGVLYHATVSQPHHERLEILRISYSWDAPRKWGRLVMEYADGGQFTISDVPAPPPMRLADLQAMVEGQNTRYITPDARFLAISSDVEPVGPMPSLVATTPVTTPDGERPVAQLQRGDTVITEQGRIVPVLHKISHTLPARGSFAPVRLRAPYFGLRNDIIVAPSQRLKISGSVVDYMFGTEAVLANASHLVGGIAAAPVTVGPFITYHHLLLPRHEAVLAAGAAVESLYVARLRRKKHLLRATLLHAYDRVHLPEHSTPAFPILRQYDALVLAEQRSA